MLRSFSYKKRISAESNLRVRSPLNCKNKSFCSFEPLWREILVRGGASEEKQEGHPIEEKLREGGYFQVHSQIVFTQRAGTAFRTCARTGWKTA